MKILKHGNYPEENKIICNECNCEFQYFGSEVKTEYSTYEEYETFGVFATFKYVICPECKHRIEIYKNIDYEHREGLLVKIKKSLKGGQTMTKEEEKAIEMLKHINRNNTLIGFKDLERSAIAETVLNMLKEKDKEAQQYFKTTIIQAEKFDEELEKKDKIIDLMADYIATLDIEEDICANVKNENCDKMNFGECENCIKQYFKRKSDK